MKFSIDKFHQLNKNYKSGVAFFIYCVKFHHSENKNYYSVLSNKQNINKDFDPNKKEQPNRVFHPKTLQLGLLDEKVTRMSGSVVRCTVLTKSNKICTIADSCIQPHEHLIEHSAVCFPELGDLSNSQLW